MRARQYRTALFAVFCLATGFVGTVSGADPQVTRLVDSSGKEEKNMIKLPPPKLVGKLTVEEALSRRRSIREYTTAAVSLEAIGQLLWSAQGVTHEKGFRTAPSAGATYPLETYLVAGNVRGLAPGVYSYNPLEHALIPHCDGDRRGPLATACLGQEWVRVAPASIAFTAVFKRTTGRYGKRGIQYVHMEIGHAAQNIYLQATSLGLGTVIVGAFEDAAVSKCLELSSEEVPLAVLPIGEPLNSDQ